MEKKEQIIDRAITALFVFVLVLALVNVGICIYVLTHRTGFEYKTYQGHTYLFYNGDPVEHSVNCQKCFERFD